MKYITIIILLLSCTLLYSEFSIIGLPEKIKNAKMISSKDISNEGAISFFKQYNPHLIDKGDLDGNKIIEYVAAFRDPQLKNKWYVVIFKKRSNQYIYINHFEFAINNIVYYIFQNMSKNKIYIHVGEAESGAMWKIEYIGNKYIVKDIGY